MEVNNFLQDFEDRQRLLGPTTLGDMNLKADYNTFLPGGCTLSDAEQQKLFHGNLSTLVQMVYHLSKKNLEQLKRESTHLLGCNTEGFMKGFLTRVIHGNVRALIDGTIPRLPVREEFLIHINGEGNSALKWMEMSTYKLHRLIDLLIHSIQGSKKITFIFPLQEATDEGKKFIRAFKDIHLCELATDKMISTQVMADAKMAFGPNNMRLNNFIKDTINSKSIVYNMFTHMRDSTLPTVERLRNEQVMRLFIMKGMVSVSFPTVPPTLEYFPFIDKCTSTIESLAEAFRAVLLWSPPAQIRALQMPAAELQKKLDAVPPKPYPPRGGGVGGGPPNGEGGQQNGGGGNPKGDPTDPTKRIQKRTIGGKPKGDQKSSSTGATDNSAGKALVSDLVIPTRHRPPCRGHMPREGLFADSMR